MIRTKQLGFTLIELVVVIIILGILAVTAAPKFINLQGDAKASTLDGFRASLQGANSLVFSKASVAGEDRIADAAGWAANTGNTAGVDIGTGTPIQTVYGYLPETAAVIGTAMDIDASSWVATAVTGGLAFSPQGAPADTCNFVYAAATATSAPTYTLYTPTGAQDPFAC
ncbi:hypothetical protein GCM10007978_03200 [Shewanella hanedai]|uniref:Prepilin-type N-terminal cleavage/methylation domain-containing protein n=1 Tax=Shewanella hanedai TaxID=25 RepID=A0A553JU83_SHEHA|nr:prepilin-type N-terminal cleavage/methylation domain-containing protein [Shewanella hanedai]TRY16006.1 prepilin-type N-terminal cleavage/methylation domain-containing protein [Shewanella hanedai]GGI68800.1 hypothetical protein GCM10007978_03200 [Shewanella hanedai]